MRIPAHVIAILALAAGSACAQNEPARRAPEAPVAPKTAEAPVATETTTPSPWDGNINFDRRTGSTLSLNGDNLYIQRMETAPVKKEKGSYLGVSASAPTAALRYQVGLKPGFGLVVDSVEPDSPAQEAGLKRFDILAKLDDQQLVNSDQLLVLIRAKNPGDTLTLAVMREGKTVTLNAKTVEKDVVPVSDLVTKLGAATLYRLSVPAEVRQNAEGVNTVLSTTGKGSNPGWMSYSKQKQILDDVSGQQWTFSWEKGLVLAAHYTESGSNKTFVYRPDHADEYPLPDVVKKALDAYLERKKTSLDEIAKSIAPPPVESVKKPPAAAPGI